MFVCVCIYREAKFDCIEKFYHELSVPKFVEIFSVVLEV